MLSLAGWAGVCARGINGLRQLGQVPSAVGDTRVPQLPQTSSATRRLQNGTLRRAFRNYSALRSLLSCQFLRCRLHRPDDLVVARAAAEVVGQVEADFVFVRIWGLVQKRLRGDQEA